MDAVRRPAASTRRPAHRGGARAAARAAVWLAATLALTAPAGSGAVRARTAGSGAVVGSAPRGAAREDQQGPTEYEVKANFLALFAKYTTWPEGVFEREDSPIVVAVVGEDPFGRALEEALRGKKAGERKLLARHFARVKDIEDPVHVLFIGGLQRWARRQLLEEWAGRPVLIVADEPGLTKEGALLGFYLHDEKVRFEARPKTARKARLVLSSQLLRHARIVD